MTLGKDFDGETLEFRPVAVVDIGSNSVRLVVYDGLRRSSTAVVNEKILCGLGRGVSLSGKLPEEGMERALAALRRFKALCRQIGVGEIFAVATAAVREAMNGPEFIQRAEAALGAPVTILAGKDEAELAALGVISGIPEADGIVGDLGGGSLELIDVKNGKIRDGVTLPLGPLRLIDMSAGSVSKARSIVDAQLEKTELLERLKGRAFYAVGGTWRNLARLHMRQSHYPLTVLQQYAMARDSARSVAGLVAGLSPASLKDIPILSRSRADTLPFGAMVLDRILTVGKPRSVVISAHGLREGLLYSKLDRKVRVSDPLLSACWEMAVRYSRAPAHELELAEWTGQLALSGMLKETAQEERLRKAASMLADISWRAHPDYRGARSLMTISQAAFVGIDHPSRIFVALVVFYRYEGSSSDDAPIDLLALLPEDWVERARILAAAMRLAYVLTAAMPGMLPSIKLESATDKALLLRLPRSHRDLMGEAVQKRLDALGNLLGRTGRVVIE